MEEIGVIEEVGAIPLDPSEEELTELASVEVPRERELAIEEIGTLTTAEFEEIEIERGGVEVKVGVRLPYIPAQLKVGKTYSIRTEHWVRVKNDSDHVVQDTARFEWIIPGVYKAWANKGFYVKKGKEKYILYTMPKRTFSFKKEGKYQLFGYTRCLGVDKPVKSEVFEVKK
jgi:hypothetical protein